MAEKLLYLQNGVYKRKEITNGIMTYNNNSFSSVAPTKNGSFYIKLDDTGVSFEEKEAALQTVNPDDMNYTKVDSNAHIIYVDSNDNFQSIIIPYGKTWFNSISYKNSNWVFDQMTLYRQMGGSTNIVGFGLPLIDKNTSNKIVTLQANETGKYVLDYTEGNTSPTLDKLSVVPSDLEINEYETGTYPHLLMINANNTFETIKIIKNNWVNALFYNNNEKKWEASQITLYQQCGWTGNINGFGIPLINYNKANTYITLPASPESGDYMFAYSGGNNLPVLKKFDSSISALTGITETGLIYNNNGIWGSLYPKTNGNFYLKYTNGLPSLEAVPASVAKVSSKLVFTATSTQLTNELNTTSLSCEGTNNFTVGKSFLLTYEFDLYTSDIEGVLGGFKSVPTLKINYETTQISEICLGNPNNYVHCSGSSIITTSTTAINLTFLLENSVTSYSFANNIKVGLVEI